MNKKILTASTLLAAAALPSVTLAGGSANAGWSSEYIFRGIFQEDSSAYAGIDYSTDSGFYVGTWGADVGLGLETDLYAGFAGGDDFTYKIGFTGYYYTDDFDDTYQEINLGIGYGIFALDFAMGEWDGGTGHGARDLRRWAGGGRRRVGPGSGDRHVAPHSGGGRDGRAELYPVH